MKRHMLLALKIVLIVDSPKSDPATFLTPHIALPVTASAVGLSVPLFLKTIVWTFIPYLIYYTSWMS